MIDTPTKKQMTAKSGPPLFTSVPPASLAIDPALQGKGDGNK